MHTRDLEFFSYYSMHKFNINIYIDEIIYCFPYLQKLAMVINTRQKLEMIISNLTHICISIKLYIVFSTTKIYQWLYTPMTWNFLFTIQCINLTIIFISIKLYIVFPSSKNLQWLSTPMTQTILLIIQCI